MNREEFWQHYAEHRMRGCPGWSCSLWQQEALKLQRNHQHLTLPPAADPLAFSRWVRSYGRAWLSQEDLFVHPEDDLQTIAIKVMVYGLKVDSANHPFYVQVRDLTGRPMLAA